ncbi:MAG: hypothetical protein QW046_04290 [Candidatus Micrarchaeaceae archaeon]
MKIETAEDGKTILISLDISDRHDMMILVNILGQETVENIYHNLLNNKTDNKTNDKTNDKTIEKTENKDGER